MSWKHNESSKICSLNRHSLSASIQPMTEPLRYPLPTGANSIAAKFAALCERYPADFVPTMRDHIADALKMLDTHAHKFLGPNMKAATALAACSNKLLDTFAALSKDHQLLVVGAIRYFIVHMDSVPDTTPIVGFDDDMLVMNHVLERLGMYEFIDE